MRNAALEETIKTELNYKMVQN